LKFSVIEPGDFGAPAFLQLPSALCAAMRDERDAGDAESFHIAMCGALRNFEALGYLARGEAAVGLEQHEGGEESVGFHFVGSSGAGVVFWEIGSKSWLSAVATPSEPQVLRLRLAQKRAKLRSG
jgi:hypothetical protein